jgi:hypothetical protein
MRYFKHISCSCCGGDEGMLSVIEYPQPLPASEWMSVLINHIVFFDMHMCKGSFKWNRLIQWLQVKCNCIVLLALKLCLRYNGLNIVFHLLADWLWRVQLWQGAREWWCSRKPTSFSTSGSGQVLPLPLQGWTDSRSTQVRWCLYFNYL